MGDRNDIPFSEYSSDFFLFLKVFLSRFFGSFSSGGGGNFSVSDSVNNFVDNLISLWNVFTVISWLVSFLLIIGIIYGYIRAKQLADIEMEGIYHQERLYREIHGGAVTNQRWADVQAHIESERPNDWKLAIIEADVMLEEMLESVGYAGTTIGDKLKSASPTAFNTLDQAWRAHRVRNEVAHGGTDFVLTKKMAQETIAQYKMVFQEFGVV